MCTATYDYSSHGMAKAVITAVGISILTTAGILLYLHYTNSHGEIAMWLNNSLPWLPALVMMYLYYFMGARQIALTKSLHQDEDLHLRVRLNLLEEGLHGVAFVVLSVLSCALFNLREELVLTIMTNKYLYLPLFAIATIVVLYGLSNSHYGMRQWGGYPDGIEFQSESISITSKAVVFVSMLAIWIFMTGYQAIYS